MKQLKASKKLYKLAATMPMIKIEVKRKTKFINEIVFHNTENTRNFQVK